MIHILTTGGTIEGLDCENDGNLVNTSSVTIASFIKTANLTFDYTIEKAFHKDSRLITIEDRELLAQVIKSSTHEKILITHGTFTMQQTAEYLGKLNLNKTLVLVGAFVSGFEIDSDASFNLGFAVSSLLLLNKGVFIAMNGKVFEWHNVYKDHKENKFKTLKE